MAKILFELREVYYSYLGKFPALCALDLAIEEGSKVAFIGANGSGKSTLLAMLDALIFPSQGSIKAFGSKLNEGLLDDPAFSQFFRKKVGLLFQNPDVQLFCPTVKEDIVFGPLQLGFSPPEVEERLDKAVAALKIAHLLERSPHQLSIGEMRKVAIASVMAVDPDILLLDEPTAGLDPQTARDIIDFVLEANEKGKTIITATHDLHIVSEISDTVHVFGQEKKIIRSGPHAEILADEEFLRVHNLVHIHRHRHKDQMHTHPHLHLDHHASGENVDKP
ncbi:MAG TPA: ABC transporter ATP-binding protein [Candidatus Margulisiibacteriota bacterium]|nr:ABC transporter ATP-binding protein [Candidatus Margulisiibacteriota bacterium]